jgi:hypothetical protein
MIASPPKKTIVWDLDDVLNNLMETWLENAWRLEHADCTTSYSQLRSNPPLAELAAASDEYLASLDRFRLSPVASELRPHPAVLNWFQRFGDRFLHHVLTARPVPAVAPASAWVFTHFGRWIRHFHFVPSPRSGESLPAYDRTKGEVLAKLGAVDFFIDDSADNVAAAAAIGINAFVFPQPWNRTEMPVSALLNELSQNA